MLVAKYKFDKSIYENLMPVFNDGYEGYTVSDEIDSENSNHIIRTIECDSLPTKMRFGDTTATDRELSLLEILDMNINEVTSLRQMFMYCENLTSITCDWNINNEVTSLRQMFYNCKLLTLVDVSRWDTSNVNNIRQIFYNCENLTQIDVLNWNTSLVDDMSYMFYDCKSLTSIDMSNWNTSLVDDMNNMFYSCDNLIQLDLSNFNMTNISNTTDIFKSCSKLQYIRCNNTSTINTLAPLLYNRTSSTQGKIITSSTNVDTTTLSSLNWSVDTSSGTKIAEYKFDKSIWNSLIPEFNEEFSGYFCNDVIEDESKPNIVTRELVGYDGLPTFIAFGRTKFDNINTPREKCLLEVLQVDISELHSMQGMFNYCNNLTYINTEGWDTSKVTEFYCTFRLCQSLTTLDVSNFDTSNVINMHAMFYWCTNLTSLDVSNFDTSNVITMSNMFNGCNNLTQLDVSNFNTSNVTKTDNMFNNCYNLTSLDVSNWDVSKVIRMGNMFQDCKNLTSLDVSNWDVSKVNSMSQMFHNCSKLVSIGDTSSWNVNLEHAASMFNNTKITSANLSGWKTSITNPSFMFMGCSNLRYVDISNVDFSNIPEDSTGASTGIFKYCSQLTDVGLLYCNATTVQKVINSATNDKIDITIWVKDTKASDYTATDYVTIKDYKEDNRTLYLNSPLLEGDEIVNKDGKLYHYHKMRSIVLDGSENWTSWNNDTNPSGYSSYYIYYNFSGSDKTLKIPIGTNTKVVCNTLKPNDASGYTSSSEGVRSTSSYLTFTLKHEKLGISDSTLFNDRVVAWKSWLSENPTTVVYELAEPYYELISDDPLIVKSYAEGKLDTSSIITPTSIQFTPYEEELTYLYTSTQYCIQFYSTANCTVDITLGGTKVENKSVLVGLNKIYITTPSELVDNKLIINAKGNATISEVVVVNSNAEFDYFDGLKSSFEDCLVTDVDNENYGKYEVGVKIVGKNKFDGELELGSINDAGNKYDLDTRVRSVNFNEIKSNTKYTTSASSPVYIALYDENKNFISRTYFNLINFKTFMTPNNARYFRLTVTNTTNVNINVQLEEGDTATSYEPYKETNATIYLNSPLLQGDKIEVVDGKLCHYHKMNKVVFDGSDDEGWCIFDNNINDSNIPYVYNRYLESVAGFMSYRDILCDKFEVISNDGNKNQHALTKYNQILVNYAKSNSGYLYVTTELSVNDFKQWLQENPTTVVYELANPYYEDITPIQSSFVISTVSEGDMEIITDLPIKSNITYLTNITSAVLMEQQLDELDNGTESLTNIVEDEINE